jgi:26S proteasome regulatory subunit N11
MKAHKGEIEDVEILWRERQDIYQPIQRALPEFLSTVQLGFPDFMPSKKEKDSLLVFMQESCLNTIKQHAANDILREQAGILCGQAFLDSDQLYVDITSVFPANTINSSAHFSFHEASWENIWSQLENGAPIVGWYHTHPGLGVFLSSTDLRTQKLYFAAPWQVAVVIDPVSSQFGFFSGAEGEPLNSERSFIYT